MSKIDCSELKIKITFFTSFVLMFLFSLLLLELFLLPFLYFLIGFPTFFSVKNDVTIHVHWIWNLGKTVVSTAGAKFDFIFDNIKLFPTKITFPDESSDWGDDSTIKWDKFDSHVSGYVLDGKISTDQSDGKLFLLLSLLLIFLPFEYFILSWLFSYFLLDISCVDFSHLFGVIIWGNPTLLIINVTVLLFFNFLYVLRNFNPSFLIIQWLFSLRILIILLFASLFLDCLFFILNNFLNNWKRLLS